MIRKSGNRFSEKIMRKENSRDPKKWEPVFRKDQNYWRGLVVQVNPAKTQ
jgi:hypothetical protein